MPSQNVKLCWKMTEQLGMIGFFFSSCSPIKQLNHMVFKICYKGMRALVTNFENDMSQTMVFIVVVVFQFKMGIGICVHKTCTLSEKRF